MRWRRNRRLTSPRSASCHVSHIGPSLNVITSLKSVLCSFSEERHIWVTDVRSHFPLLCFCAYCLNQITISKHNVYVFFIAESEGFWR
jgi:hypothetical protein